MSLQSLFKSPSYLIHRFRYFSLYSRSVWIYLILISITVGVVYLFLLFPVYVLLSLTGLLFGSILLNRIYDAFIVSRNLEIRDDTTTLIYKYVEEVKDVLEFNKKAKIYIKKGDPEVNCVSFLGVRRIFIGSQLLDPDIDENHFKFAIAQAIIQCKIKRMLFFFFEPFIDDLERLIVFNFFIYSFDRAATYTADRIGTLLSGSHDHCTHLMEKKLIGNSDYDIRSHDYLKQAELNQNFFCTFINIFLKSPAPVRRMKNIQSFYEKYRILYAKRHENDEVFEENSVLTLELY